MTSDDERREVARKLRVLPSDTYAAIKEWEQGGIFIDASLSDEADYSQIHNAVFGCFPAEHMHPGDYEEIHNRLADLIDRPVTTRNRRFRKRHGWEVPLCEVCGQAIGDARWNYCPRCGAAIMEVEK